jgi:hypothetical protein
MIQQADERRPAINQADGLIERLLFLLRISIHISVGCYSLLRLIALDRSISSISRLNNLNNGQLEEYYSSYKVIHTKERSNKRI